jgi:hypothetical protein
MDREALEQAALMAIAADDYYDLLDNLSETTDDELLAIIEENTK